MSPLHKLSRRALLWVLLLICLAVMNAAPAQTSAGADEAGLRWWKGNLHTHAFWSDGDDFPEMVVRWYKEHGYHFLALSDHNRLPRGQRWTVVTGKRRAAFDKYRGQFGEHWIETRKDEKEQTVVWLKPLSEYRCLFEQPDRFLLIEAEEITEKAHLNAMNAGDFYCSTGVTIAEITFQDNTLTVRVAPEPGVTYTTRFVGTQRGYDPDSRAVADAEGKEIRTTRRYSRDVGATLAKVEGTTARYMLKGDEIYVRAKVISSRQNENSHVPGEYESAWAQPVVVKQ